MAKIKNNNNPAFETILISNENFKVFLLLAIKISLSIGTIFDTVFFLLINTYNAVINDNKNPILQNII
jgi:hypothetical protein